MLNRLGANRMRSVVIDLESHDGEASCLLTCAVGLEDAGSDRGWNSARILDQVRESPIGKVFVKRFGVQRSVYAWRKDPQVAVVTEVRFQEGARLPTDVDAALVQRACLASLGAGAASADATRNETAPPTESPSSDALRPRISKQWFVATWSSVVLMLACAALGAWLFTTAVDARDTAARAESELTRLRTLMGVAAARSVAAVLAKGDYGEVQEVLSPYAEIDYVSKAAVINASQRVVAVAGDWRQVQIGAPVPEGAVRGAKSFELRAGSEKLGQLLVVLPPQNVTAIPDGDYQLLRVLSAAIYCCALIAAVVLSAYLWKTGRPEGRNLASPGVIRGVPRI
jgi:hypothetical protein